MHQCYGVKLLEALKLYIIFQFGWLLSCIWVICEPASSKVAFLLLVCFPFRPCTTSTVLIHRSLPSSARLSIFSCSSSTASDLWILSLRFWTLTPISSNSQQVDSSRCLIVPLPFCPSHLTLRSFEVFLVLVELVFWYFCTCQERNVKIELFYLLQFVAHEKYLHILVPIWGGKDIQFIQTARPVHLISLACSSLDSCFSHSSQ